jgi:hypothetical protein
MQTYKITFTARYAGSIGKVSKFTKSITSDTFDNAHLNLYSKFEHISIINYKTI